VERILQNPTFLHGKDVGCLVIAPTRELAIQIGDEAEKLLLHHDLSVQVMYGGTKMARDINAMNKRLPAILVATPGRLMDHLQGTKVRGRKFGDDIISNVDILVLDEVDRLVDLGMRREIQKILSYLPRKEKRQTMLFSATIPKELKRIMKDSMKDDFLEVDCVKDGLQTTPTNLRVTQTHVILPDFANVMHSVYAILKKSTTTRPYKIVVFFPTARMVSFFAEFLNDGLEYPVIELHSKKSQSSRNTASSNFRRSTNAILFTSDLSARGVDYPDVTQVIQVGMPESREQYIHRLGRTARAGKEGSGILVLFPFESGFLSELKGLDVASNDELLSTLTDLSDHDCPAWMTQNYSKVSSGGNKLATSAQLAYLSFLGYYLGQRTRIQKQTKNDVVSLSNEFSQAIGLAAVPSIPRKLITKMELEGVPGVISEDD
jgi:ATP-dependent RNA helicase MSS116